MTSQFWHKYQQLQKLKFESWNLKAKSCNLHHINSDSGTTTKCYGNIIRAIRVIQRAIFKEFVNFWPILWTFTTLAISNKSHKNELIIVWESLSFLYCKSKVSLRSNCYECLTTPLSKDTSLTITLPNHWRYLKLPVKQLLNFCSHWKTWCLAILYFWHF